MYHLGSDGIEVVEDFLGKDVIQKLNSEFDRLAAKISIYGREGCYPVSKNYKAFPHASYVFRKANLIEIAIDIRDVLVKSDQSLNDQKLVLTSIEAYEETSEVPLPWHTDNREGMLRAFIYIQGGSADSGALTYMTGTHVRDFYVEHALTEEQINQLNDKIITAEADVGSLILVNTMGFHGNSPRRETRRILVFEYQRYSQTSKKSTIILPSFCITPKVLQNISLIQNNADPYEYAHGDDYFCKNETLMIPDKIIEKVVRSWGKLFKNRIFNINRKLEKRTERRD